MGFQVAYRATERSRVEDHVGIQQTEVLAPAGGDPAIDGPAVPLVLAVAQRRHVGAGRQEFPRTVGRGIIDNRQRMGERKRRRPEERHHLLEQRSGIVVDGDERYVDGLWGSGPIIVGHRDSGAKVWRT